MAARRFHARIAGLGRCGLRLALHRRRCRTLFFAVAARHFLGRPAAHLILALAPFLFLAAAGFGCLALTALCCFPGEPDVGLLLGGAAHIVFLALGFQQCGLARALLVVRQRAQHNTTGGRALLQGRTRLRRCRCRGVPDLRFRCWLWSGHLADRDHRARSWRAALHDLDGN